MGEPDMTTTPRQDAARAAGITDAEIGRAALLAHGSKVPLAREFAARGLLSERNASPTDAEVIAELTKALDGMVKCHDPIALTHPPESKQLRMRLEAVRAALARAEASRS